MEKNNMTVFMDILQIYKKFNITWIQNIMKKDSCHRLQHFG